MRFYNTIQITWIYFAVTKQNIFVIKEFMLVLTKGKVIN